MTSRVVSYLNDPHDTDLVEIRDLVLAGQKPNHHCRMIGGGDAPYGFVVVVWEGDPKISDQELGILFLRTEWKDAKEADS